MVEVITSVVLLSTLLVGMLTAYSRHVRQLNRASELNVAVELTDQLLADWFRESNPLSDNRTGIFEGNPDFFWRVNLNRTGPENQVGARIIVLQVLKTKEPASTPVLEVDLLAEIPNAFQGAR